MTTITIKDGQKKFAKTSFATAENLLEYLLEYLYFDETLPELTKEELFEASKAKKEWQEKSVKFRKVIQ